MKFRPQRQPFFAPVDAVEDLAVHDERAEKEVRGVEVARESKRFFRKRYIDPFTGKKEWRLIHTNGMMLTDSLVQKRCGW